MNKEKLFKLLFFFAAVISILAVITICAFLFIEGVPAMSEIGIGDFLMSQKWKPVNTPPDFGILSMVAGSFYVTGLAIFMGVPVGVMCAVFLAYFCPKKLYRILKPSVNLLAGIPSILFGFFGMQVVVPIVRDNFSGNGYSILSASIVLAIMILPTIIGMSEAAIRAVPAPMYEGALGLGATKEESVFKVVVPAAKSGIVTSVILGIGRAIGETMAVVMVAGGAVMPLDKIALLKPVRTLTANIVMEMSYSSGLHTGALIATGVVLFVFILLLNLCVHLVRKGASSK